MSEAIPPSPASYAGSDWSTGPRGYPQPGLKTGSPGPGGGRAGLPTPPVSGSSNGSGPMNGVHPPPGPFMGAPPPRGDSRGAPSPPQSLGRLSTSSNMSMRDPEAARRRNQMIEDSLQQHYQILRGYLASDLRRDPEGKSKKAKDKLQRLSPIQFFELSTDVYDELRRRQNQHRAPPGVPPHLVPKENFHPKRNQARQKLSTLPEARFRDLATDVFFELDLRFPRFSGRAPGRNGSPSSMGPPSRSGTPGFGPGHRGRQDSLASQIMSPGPDGFAAQKSTRGDTIVPNKSYLVEDDDEADMDSIYGIGKRDTTATTKSFGGGRMIGEYQQKLDDLQSKVTELEKQVQEKDEEIERAKSDPDANEDAEMLRQSLEEKLESAQALNRNLQEEIDAARADHERTELDLRSQLDDMSQRDSESSHLRAELENLRTDQDNLRGRHNSLQVQHESLQRQLQESSGGGEWRTRCEDLEGENQTLRSSVQEQQRVTQEVRSEAAGFLAEMRSLIDESDKSHEREERLSVRNSQLEAELSQWKERYSRAKAQLSSRRASTGLDYQQSAIGQNLRSPSGLIRSSDVTTFQVGIDDVLRTARSGSAADVLEKVKVVVSAVRPMVQSVANTRDPKVVKLRNRLTATINNFITAGKNHIQSGGISPVSLLDAAASHLSAAVVELADNIKVRPSEVGEEEHLPSTSYQNQAPAPTPAPFSQSAAPNARETAVEDEDEEDYDEDDVTGDYYSDQPSVPALSAAIPLRKPVGSAEPAPEPEGELLPSTTYQLPSTTYIRPEAPIAAAPAAVPPTPAAMATPARKPVGAGAATDAAPAPLTNGNHAVAEPAAPAVPEVNMDELKRFLDDQTSALITSIQLLVTSIRGNSPATEVHGRLATITTTSSQILERVEPALSARDAKSVPLVAALQASFDRLRRKQAEGAQMDEEQGPEWKKWCQGVPPQAFEIARVVKDLGSRVRVVAQEGPAAAEDYS